MKKLLFLAILAVMMTFNAEAQVYKSVYVTNAGTLGSLLTFDEKNSITNLTVSGNLDVRDFVTMCYYMYRLTDLDISTVTIQAFNGLAYYQYSPKSYAVNEMPENLELWPILKSITLPNSITSIGHQALAGFNRLTSIIIPNGVKTIGGSAFRGLTGLTDVIIPNEVVQIGIGAFYGCSNLQSVSFGSGLISIGQGAFSYTGIKSIDIPKTIVTMDGAFQYCSALTNMNFANGITSIGNGTFAQCTNLSELNIPGSVKSIGVGAFQNCTGLTNINFGEGIKLIDDGAFYGCHKLTNLIIPNSVTKIGTAAFYDCWNLANLTLGNSVDSIMDVAFNSCGVKVINCLNNKPPKITNPFQNTAVTDVYVPNVTALAAYKANPDWIGYFPGNIMKIFPTNITYSVTVPVGTNACYIAGTMNNWIQQTMTKIDATHFNLNIPTATINDTYKYCSGPIWAYEELDANNNVISNRSYSSNDVVAKWKSVYSDVKTVNSDNIKLISGKSFIRAEFDGNANIEVYNLSGLLMKQANATNTISIDNLNTGLYIVKINGTAYKVVVE